MEYKQATELTTSTRFHNRIWRMVPKGTYPEIEEDLQLFCDFWFPIIVQSAIKMESYTVSRKILSYILCPILEKYYHNLGICVFGTINGEPDCWCAVKVEGTTDYYLMDFKIEVQNELLLDEDCVRAIQSGDIMSLPRYTVGKIPIHLYKPTNYILPVVRANHCERATYERYRKIGLSLVKRYRDEYSRAQLVKKGFNHREPGEEPWYIRDIGHDTITSFILAASRLWKPYILGYVSARIRGVNELDNVYLYHHVLEYCLTRTTKFRFHLMRGFIDEKETWWVEHRNHTFTTIIHICPETIGISDPLEISRFNPDAYMDKKNIHRYRRIYPIVEPQVPPQFETIEKRMYKAFYQSINAQSIREADSLNAIFKQAYAAHSMY